MTIDGASLALPVGPRDHARGSLDAPVTLVEYGDYECPHCGAAHPVAKEILRRLGSRLCFAYRHFPLTQAHPHAQAAAEAAEAAGAQGQFWAMHDTLFANQNALDDAHLLAYAAALRLDVDRFAGDLAARVHAPRVREDFLSGIRSGVNGTPSFFINGRRHDGAFDLESLLNAIGAELAPATLTHGGAR